MNTITKKIKKKLNKNNIFLLWTTFYNGFLDYKKKVRSLEESSSSFLLTFKNSIFLKKKSVFSILEYTICSLISKNSIFLKKSIFIKSEYNHISIKNYFFLKNLLFSYNHEKLLWKAVHNEIPLFFEFFWFFFTMTFATIHNIMNNKFMIAIMNKIS
jgi:hypothetical protein